MSSSCSTSRRACASRMPGSNADQSRMKRASVLMDSFLERIPVELYLVSVVACYNGAKPVVVDTKDLEVVRNIFGDLPMQYAFPTGKTDLFSGLTEAAKIAHPWQPRSTLLMMISDGDTVPATGMPKMPASIADVLIVGVGDPRQGSFIDGRMSRQDTSTLRQIAARLGGIYHDGNSKHIPHFDAEAVDRHPAQEHVRAAHTSGIRVDRLRTRGLDPGVPAGPLAPVRHPMAAGRGAEVSVSGEGFRPATAHLPLRPGMIGRAAVPRVISANQAPATSA